MEFLNLLYKRRSIRKYKEEEIKQEELNKIIEAALLSPSSRNKKSWNFMVIRNKEIIEKLALSKERGSELIKESNVIIVVLGDSSISDVWIEDCSIASIIIQLEAENLGIGSCWIQVRNRYHNKEKNITSEEYIKGILKIKEEEVRVESVIALGYKNEYKKEYKKEDLNYEKVKFL
ncbi:nitroreductase [Hypnocyclicus thermotrophus]|uniref:Nitroreductase n=1 Tax=Hypnocyclicus thermotrophus TaxID=1627895 RepID=A0AA46E0F9_9FUSO|nr:nitroreductase family protein [Hypnocyclicus thermotrophus]TDT72036.1 nitroreductase [Hypnocyclicus thermotrophus]